MTGWLVIAPGARGEAVMEFFPRAEEQQARGRARALAVIHGAAYVVNAEELLAPPRRLAQGPGPESEASQ
mgnify:CR=1 FL=1